MIYAAPVNIKLQLFRLTCH